MKITHEQRMEMNWVYAVDCLVTQFGKKTYSPLRSVIQYTVAVALFGDSGDNRYIDFLRIDRNNINVSL